MQRTPGQASPHREASGSRLAVDAGTERDTEAGSARSLDITRVSRISVWILAAVLVVSGIATLPRYGLTCDEAWGNMFFGERYLHYFLTFDRSYLDFQKTDLPIHHRQPNLLASNWRVLPAVFPPLADTLSAGTMELLGHRLHWMDPIDGFHTATILMVGLFLPVLFEFAAPRIGPGTALAGIAMLITHPRLWGDLHNNVKDVPEMVFFALVVMAAARWAARPRVGTALLAGILGGAALAVKVNAAFIPFVVVAGLWPFALSWNGWRPVAEHLLRTWWHYLLMVIAALATFYCVWPWLYTNPIVRFGKHVKAFVNQGHRLPHPGWNPDPILQIITTMPELMLGLLLLGTVLLVARVATSRDETGTFRLLLAWMIVPVLRNSWPGAVNFDGIRHFYEFLPPAALIAALGARSLIGLVRPHWRTAAAAALASAVGANAAAAIVRYHPYETAYFNRFVGGLSGAARVFPEATDYWGGSYRQGLEWLGQHAENGSALFVAVHPHIVGLVSEWWLRPGIELIDSSGYEPALAARRPLYVMFVTRPEFYDDIARKCEANLAPVHQILVDGHPILSIYRLQGEPPGGAS